VPVSPAAVRPNVEDEEDAASDDCTTKTREHCRQRIFLPTIRASAVYDFWHPGQLTSKLIF
jgi:hypothetical protein